MAKHPRQLRPSGHLSGTLRTSKRRGWVKTCTKIQRGKCYWCGEALGQDATADHLIPLSRGGEDAISNVVAAHAACNRRKGSLMPTEYRALLEAERRAAFGN